jgi:glycosyltransferase involved in cell wall biosynthesis
MKNVLFITYFWPPSGKASLHWPLAMIRHLPEHGWQPVVLTVDEDTFSQRDESLLGSIDPALRVVKTASNDPFELYRKFLGKKSDAPLVASETISMTNTDLRHRIAVWIRMNLFVPDARIGWFFSAVRGGTSIIRSQKIDAIVSNGPPHSAHLIGKYLSRKFSIPHIPVLIDPWVDIAYYRGFTRSRATLALDNYFERSVFAHASRVVFVTDSAREAYVKKYPSIQRKASVLYWGYNEENFAHAAACAATGEPQRGQSAADAREEIVLHAGNIFDFQNPPGLWKNVKREIEAGRKLKLRFIGTVSPGIIQAIEEHGLTPYAEYKGFLPFSQVVDEMCGADFLFVCATEKRHVPGKLFEYLRAGKPVVAFGDDNEEVAALLRRCSAGILLPYSYQGDDLFTRLASVRPDAGAARAFSRAEIAAGLAGLLAGISS